MVAFGSAAAGLWAALVAFGSAAAGLWAALVAFGSAAAGLRAAARACLRDFIPQTPFFASRCTK